MICGLSLVFFKNCPDSWIVKKAGHKNSGHKFYRTFFFRSQDFRSQKFPVTIISNSDMRCVRSPFYCFVSPHIRRLKFFKFVPRVLLWYQVSYGQDNIDRYQSHSERKKNAKTNFFLCFKYSFI